MHFADIAIGRPLYGTFTYRIPESIEGLALPGSRVAVPFRRRMTVGYIMDIGTKIPASLDAEKIHAIDAVLDDEPVFARPMLAWLSWMASYYCAPIGEICRAALPARLNRLDPPKTVRPTLPRDMEHRGQETAVVLTADQRAALDHILHELRRDRPTPVLLHGITGSGKTEIYLRLFEALAAEGAQAIMLVPEIGLTPQLVSRIAATFGDRVALYHSGLSDAQRHHQWERMRRGEAVVAIGTRSALFAPLPRLRAIVVDEEHDPSYKQDEGVLYHARDAAVMRANLEAAAIVLGSATPSMESYANADAGKYRYLHLPERTGGGQLPVVDVIDMRHEAARQAASETEHSRRHERSSLAPAMVKAVAETLERGEQSMIFLNRRGFAHFLICAACGHAFECPNCNISLAYHRQPARLLCHYCEYAITPPDACPACGGVELEPMGRGTERIEQELGELFPRASIARLDRDTTAKSSTRSLVYRKMRSGAIDILVGTQMIAKGHDFPNITLVGIVAADVALHLPDFRAAERTFQLITQMSGRAGRSSSGARVILQTYQPDHPSLVHARTHDYRGFYDGEKKHRRDLGYPPFMRLANIRMSSPDAAKAARLAHKAADALGRLAAGAGARPSVALLGPAPAPMEKVRNRFRWQLLIKAATARTMASFLSASLPSLGTFEREGLRIAIDVDPVHMM